MDVQTHHTGSSSHVCEFGFLFILLGLPLQFPLLIIIINLVLCYDAVKSSFVEYGKTPTQRYELTVKTKEPFILNIYCKITIHFPFGLNNNFVYRLCSYHI